MELPKGSQTTCRVWRGMQDGSGANEGESGFISNWFGVHWAISHSCGDISVLLELWQCSWQLSGVSSGKSRLFTCLIGNTELFCRQCRGIGPHLTVRGNSHVFSWVAVGIWGIFLRYGQDDPSKLLFVQQNQDSSLVTRDTSGISTRLGRVIQMLLEVRRDTEDHFQLPQ